MDTIETIKELLELNHIDTEPYTTETINILINQAKQLCQLDKETTTTDYEHTFNNQIYITQNYPIKDTTQVETRINNKKITPHKITPEGIIYFKNTQNGELEITYPVGLPEEDIQQYIIPIVIELIKNIENKNLASISEGGISLTYNTANNTQTSLDQLINTLKNKYHHRVAFI